MGQIANIVDYRRTQPVTETRVPGALNNSQPSILARLIPGSSLGPGQKYSPPIAAWTDCIPAESVQRSFWSRIAAELAPRCLLRFSPQMMTTAALDLALILLTFLAGQWLPGLPLKGITLSLFWAYVSVFLIFSVEEGLYSHRQASLASQIGAALRALVWTTFFAGFAASAASIHVLAVVIFSVGNFCMLVIARWGWREIAPTDDFIRNVLIVGSGVSAQEVAKAIHADGKSKRQVRGFMAENHLRNIYGPEMFARIARQEFIDEVIVASPDEKAAQIAIREARRNKLDVKAAPLTIVLRSSAETVFETVGKVTLFNIEDHEVPEFKLALKRFIDVTAALLGLLALSPAFLLIAALIKQDSPGPIVYRAPRIGSKGRRFTCYKFRTMVPEADAIKSSLRSMNERTGAFFKIENDPRVTRLGKFLRRFSLDELPQLWNVARGEMSLVGPRPHPPDDVELYELRHLQRLDFFPGITGLWQITARRDPSFERSVALDVQYINKWSLWLDAQILWRTLFVVIEGSGA